MKADIRTFTPADQEQFACLSGDSNPMHVDPVAARRTQAGATVVHGIHALLWALESLAEMGRLRGPLAVIDVEFQKFIYVGSPAAMRVTSETEGDLQLELLCDGTLAAIIAVTLAPPGNEAGSPLGSHIIDCREGPIANDLKDLAGLAGRLPKGGHKGLNEKFPHLAAMLGENRLRAIVQTSMLVGMVCPGLHSIYNRLAIRLTSARTEDDLSFRVSNIDERFCMVEMEIAGNGIVGEISAFVRPAPVAQPGFREIAKDIRRNEFGQTTAFIVGGSRGLGAVTAKAIAAGGGRVILTYAVGRADAEDIRDEICTECGPDACRIFPYDVRKGFNSQAAALDWKVNQLYYFATPQIFRQSGGLYGAARLGNLLHFYVTAFYDICEGLRCGNTENLRAFYPSTIFIEQRERGMTEYAMAKAAGEILCADMNMYLKGVQVIVARLPRILTDQNATVVPTDIVNALDVMVPLVRQMHAAAP